VVAVIFSLETCDLENVWPFLRASSPGGYAAAPVKLEFSGIIRPVLARFAPRTRPDILSAGMRRGKYPRTIFLPRAMKKFIDARLREGSLSTPSVYLRSLRRTLTYKIGEGRL
jgi:hypothetical protein